MAIEHELKFSTTEEHVPSLAELRAALGTSRLTLSPAEVRRHLDTYFDDTAGSLAATGWALRLRRQRDGASIATLKGAARLSGALHSRQEIEVELPEGTSDALSGEAWPAAIVTALPGHLDAGRLRALLELNVRRLAVDVALSGRRVAQLAFDEVVCSPPGQADSGLPLRDSPHFTFHEVEIEAIGPAQAAARADAAVMAPGSAAQPNPAVLEELARAVGELLPLTPSKTSKLERARVLLGPFLEDP